MWKRRSNPFLTTEDGESDPLSGMANLIDVMLVFVAGLLVALVLSWNLEDQLIKKVVEVEQGEELRELPLIQEKGGGGDGFSEMGKVYRDPKTGQLILIQSEDLPEE